MGVKFLNPPILSSYATSNNLHLNNYIQGIFYLFYFILYIHRSVFVSLTLHHLELFLRISSWVADKRNFNNLFVLHIFWNWQYRRLLLFLTILSFWLYLFYVALDNIRDVNSSTFSRLNNQWLIWTNNQLFEEFRHSQMQPWIIGKKSLNILNAKITTTC
jgi:hypothetical protein